MNETLLHRNDNTTFDTFTGKIISVVNFDESQVDIIDIAHSMSLVCRFNGHCKFHYPVGRHCLMVCDILETFNYKDDESKYKTCLAGLLHDSAEVYTGFGDVVRPAKNIYKGLRESEQKILGKVMEKFGAVGADWNYVKRADDIAVLTEAIQLMPSGITYDWDNPHSLKPIDTKIHEVHPRIIEKRFLTKFNDITEKLQCLSGITE